MGAEAAASQVLVKLQSLIGAESFVYPGLRDQVNQLQQVLSSLKDTERSLQSSSEIVSGWEARLLRAIYSADDITDSFLLATAQHRRKRFSFTTTHWASLKTQKRLSNEIKEFLRKLSLDFADMQGGPDLVHNDNLGGGSTSSIFPNELERKGRISQSDIVGVREENENKLLDQLFRIPDDNLCVISVVGKEALGKTALVRNVCNRVDVKGHFKCRAWVHVPRDFVYKDILASILKQIPVSISGDLEHMKEEKLSEMLCKILMKHRYLIVLDDVWTVDVWHMLVVPFADSKNGSRVIITTRDIDLAQQADPWTSPIQLHPLTDKESWALLLTKVNTRPETSSDNINSELNNYKEKILRKCHGLPPAIVLLGGLLSTTELSEWSRVIEFAKFGEDQSPLLHIVAFCYHKLPSWLKPCFLYLGLFPKAFEIPTQRLLRLWLAEGFLWLLPERKVPEDLAEIYLQELVSRNMIEIAQWKSDGSPKSCCMPGFLYDVFFPKAVDVGLFHVHSRKPTCRPAESSDFDVWRLAEHFDMKCYDALDFHIQHLRSYVSFDTRKRGTPNREIGRLLKTITAKRGIGLLKVLDLEGVYRPLLPDDIGKLLNLRYIGLRWTNLDSLPKSVGNLPSLETLDFKYTNITTLPSSIWKAKKLRHLYMNDVYAHVSIQKMSSEFLTNLQTLSGLFIGANNPMINGLARLTGLRKLGLTCHSTSVEAIANCIPQLTNLKSLRLRCRDSFGQPSNLKFTPMGQHQSLLNLKLLGLIPDGVGGLPYNLKILTLSMSELKEDPMPALGQLPQLNILRLFAHSYIGKQMTCLHGQFPRLRVLKIWKLEKLEQLTMEDGAMPQLQELEIRCCKVLMKSEGLEKVPKLKELILTNMPLDFVDDVNRNMGCRDIFISVNNWDFSPLHD